MKNRIIALGLGAAVLCAVPAFSGINPALPGLPGQTTGGLANWNPASTIGYSGTPNFVGNPVSSMCVECHGLNPSARVLVPFKGGAGFYQVSKTVDQGSHAVFNGTPGNTNSGGGFTGGASGARNGGQYEKVTAWASTGALSKYGTGTNMLNQGTLARGGDYDMICESCHNVLANTGDQLIVETFGHGSGATSDTLCLGCHSDGATTLGDRGTYTGFHKNGNLKAFGTTAAQSGYTDLAGRKKHHVLQGDTLDYDANPATASAYNPDGVAASNDSVMWAPSYTQKLGDTGVYKTWVYQAAKSPAKSDAFAFRTAWNVSGQGTRATAMGPVTGLPGVQGAAVVGDIHTGTELRCNSCHRPHNAMTKAGAFILRTGDGSDYTSLLTTGLTRQNDAGDHSAQGSKVYGEYLSICNGCHTGYK